ASRGGERLVRFHLPGGIDWGRQSVVAARGLYRELYVRRRYPRPAARPGSASDRSWSELLCPAEGGHPVPAAHCPLPCPLYAREHVRVERAAAVRCHLRGNHVRRGGERADVRGAAGGGCGPGAHDDTPCSRRSPAPP